MLLSGAFDALPIDYYFTGTLTPDSTGGYRYGGLFNGSPYYIRNAGGWYQWWDPVLKWIVSTEVGVTGAAYWKKAIPPITGTYSPQGTATGNGVWSLP